MMFPIPSFPAWQNEQSGNSNFCVSFDVWLEGRLTAGIRSLLQSTACLSTSAQRGVRRWGCSGLNVWLCFSFR